MQLEQSIADTINRSFYSGLAIALMGCLSVVLAATPARAELAVFPGAEGFGSTTQAGRGGVVCIVKSLENAGTDTLRSCLEAKGPRNVVFAIGGTIKLESTINISEPFISIYGQTATGDGILLRSSLDSSGPPLRVSTHDVLIQHLRIRAGSSSQQTCCRDSIAIGNEKLGNVYNVVLDHNSLSWATDEIVDIWYDSNNITLSYNIIAEGLHNNRSNTSGPAGRGIIVGAEGSHSISIHHNYIAHTFQRSPLLLTSGIVDFANNLVYQWVSRAAEQRARFEGQKVNWVNNHIIARKGASFFTRARNKLDSVTHYKFGVLHADTAEEQTSAINWGDILIPQGEKNQSFYASGNLGYHRRTNYFDDFSLIFTDWKKRYDPESNVHSNIRFGAPVITEIPAIDLTAYLPPLVGATLPKRSSVDHRIMLQLENHTGKMPDCVGPDDRENSSDCSNNAGGWPTLSSGEARVDTDRDGIPDDWETAHGLDPNTFDSELDSDNDGYTNLENWIHNLNPEK